MSLTLLSVVDQVWVTRLRRAVPERQGTVYKVIAIYEVSVGVGLHMARDVIIGWAQKNHEA